MRNFKDSTTWMKETLKTKERHKEKLDNVLINKRINKGIRKIPNQTITNLLGTELNDDKIAVLKLGLKHGLLIRPKENEMIAVMEDIYDQIVCQYLLKKDDI